MLIAVAFLSKVITITRAAAMNRSFMFPSVFVLDECFVWKKFDYACNQECMTPACIYSSDSAHYEGELPSKFPWKFPWKFPVHVAVYTVVSGVH